MMKADADVAIARPSRPHAVAAASSATAKGANIVTATLDSDARPAANAIVSRDADLDLASVRCMRRRGAVADHRGRGGTGIAGHHVGCRARRAGDRVEPVRRDPAGCEPG